MLPELSFRPKREARTTPERSDAAPSKYGCPLSDLRDRLRRAGLRPTRQRLSLGWIIFSRADRHLTAEMLYGEAMQSNISVSLAKIYNNINQFTEAGLLRQLVLDGSKAYFDTNPSENYHFYLENEGKVVDMDNCNAILNSLPEAPDGMEIIGVESMVRVRAK